jgi:hypothetical protein
MFKKSVLVLSLLSSLLLVSHSIRAGEPGSASGPAESDADFDRLDGTGTSGKKVNVIEWEGNLEIHVYPGGSLKGLSLKLDKKNKNKPVMVIGYRFGGGNKPELIRRAILGVEFHEGFKAYRDTSSGSEYDKVIISNNGLSGLVAMRLDPEMTQLYPDGHPALLAGKDDSAKTSKIAEKRAPAAEGSESDDAPQGVDEDSGAIQPFFMKAERHMNRK